MDTERVKRTVLIDFVATLARVLTRRGNRVGAILYDTEVERVLPARGGRDQVLRMIDDLLHQRVSPTPRHGPRTAPPGRPQRHKAPFVGLRDLRLHQPARLERQLSLLNRRTRSCGSSDRPREVQLPDVAADHGRCRNR